MRITYCVAKLVIKVWDSSRGEKIAANRQLRRKLTNRLLKFDNDEIMTEHTAYMHLAEVIVVDVCPSRLGLESYVLPALGHIQTYGGKGGVSL